MEYCKGGALQGLRRVERRKGIPGLKRQLVRVYLGLVWTPSSQNCTDPVTVSMVGEGVVFQGMRGYTVSPHAPAVACFTMSVTQHFWLKKKYYRVPIFNPVVSEATRLSGYQP